MLVCYKGNHPTIVQNRRGPSCARVKNESWEKSDPNPCTIVCKREESYELVWNKTRDQGHHTIAQIEGNPSVLVWSVEKAMSRVKKPYTIADLGMCSCMVH